MGNSGTWVSQHWLWLLVFFCGCWKYIPLSYKHLNHIFPHFTPPSCTQLSSPPSPFPFISLIFKFFFISYFYCISVVGSLKFSAGVYMCTGVHVCPHSHTCQIHNNNNTHKKTSIIFSQDAPHAVRIPQFVIYMHIWLSRAILCAQEVEWRTQCLRSFSSLHTSPAALPSPFCSSCVSAPIGEPTKSMFYIVFRSWFVFCGFWQKYNGM